MAGTSTAEHVLLTPEITLKVFSYLRTKDICLLSRVCKAWRNIARDRKLIAVIDLENCIECRDTHIFELLMNISDHNLPKVRSLNIAGTGVTDAVLPLLTSWCTEIKRLHLSGAQINKKTFIRAGKHLKHLRELSIRDCHEVDHEMAKQLVELVPNLSHLCLPGCKNFDDKALKEIAIGFPDLTALDISYCPQITDGGMELLIESSKKLKSLDVSGCPVLKYTTVLFVRSKCQNLQKIRAIDTRLTESGLDLFLKCPLNKKLKNFSIIANPTESMEVIVGIFRVSVPK